MRFHFWHTVLSLFFVACAVLAYLWLASADRLASFVPLGDFLLMTLAVMRLVRLFTYDAITAFVREWFAGADPASLRGSLGTLINCSWCTGLWFALVVVFFYFATPIAWYAIFVLALAAAGSFSMSVARLVQWDAEVKKRQAR